MKTLLITLLLSLPAFGQTTLLNSGNGSTNDCASPLNVYEQNGQPATGKLNICYNNFATTFTWTDATGHQTVFNDVTEVVSPRDGNQNGTLTYYFNGGANASVQNVKWYFYRGWSFRFTSGGTTTLN